MTKSDAALLLDSGVGYRVESWDDASSSNYYICPRFGPCDGELYMPSLCCGTLGRTSRALPSVRILSTCRYFRRRIEVEMPKLCC
jgi:hypothetical protein